MKTIAVLAALAAVATAVPALPGYSYGYRSAPYRLPQQQLGLVRREKKSTELLTNEGTIDSVLPQLDTTPEEEARTLFLKKPIIKKKIGYPHYRDTDEEGDNEAARATEDARERCAKEVKVKFCDAENLTGLTGQKRSTDENSFTSNIDMTQSINIAREAIENLQKTRHFQKIEPNKEDELNKDIAIARNALEHIQKNFGNLQSMNLQATTLSEEEVLKGAKAEEKRMASWKESIENIQRHADIPRNIEDNFKTADFSRSETIAKESEAIKENIDSKSTVEADVKTPVSSVTVEEKAAIQNSLETKRNVEQMNEMDKPAASELKETRVALENIPIKAKEASLKLDDVKVSSVAIEEKAAQQNSFDTKRNVEHMNEMLPAASELKETRVALENIPIKAKEASLKLDDVNVSSVAIEEKAAQQNSLDTKRNVEQMNEMLPAASELKETKVALENIPIKAKEASLKLDDVKVSNGGFEKNIEADNIKIGKSSEMDVSLHAPVPTLNDKETGHEQVLKAAEIEQGVETEENVKNMKTSEIIEDLPTASVVPALRTVSVTNNNVNGAERQFLNDEEENTPLAKNTENISVDVMNVDMSPRNEHGKTAVIDTTSLMKSEENNQKFDLHKENVMQAKESDLDHLQKQRLSINEMNSNLRAHEGENLKQHLVVLDGNNLQKNAAQSLPLFKAADHKTPAFDGKALGNLHPEVSMRVPESSNMHQQLHESSDLRFQSQGKSWNADQMATKSKTIGVAEADRAAHIGFQSGMSMETSMLPHGQFVQPMHGPHMQTLHHQHHQMHTFHNGPHVGFMGIGKSADVDSASSPSSQVNVNEELLSKAALNQGGLMNWKQKEGARGAYGLSPFGAAAAAAAAAAGGAGAGGLNIAAGAGGSGASALGVFPGAKVGGCAIPLLLSCSPSVVPGTLAQSSAYAAPHAYRSSGDFDNRFHNKRDTKKFTGTLTKTKRTTAKTIQKIPLEKKL